MSIDGTNTKKRTYTMSARAQTVQETEQRILNVALDLFSRYAYDSVSLDQIAEQAEVTIPTVIRHFGTKEQLFRASVLPPLEQAYKERMDESVGNVEIAVESLFQHYERWGQFILHLQFQKERIASLQEVLAIGRHAHTEWLKRSFAPQLEALPAALSRRRFAQLMVATDVFSWYTLRREYELDEQETREAWRELLGPLFNN